MKISFRKCSPTKVWSNFNLSPRVELKIVVASYEYLAILTEKPSNEFEFVIILDNLTIWRGDIRLD